MALRVLSSELGRTATLLIDSANGTIAPGNASLAVSGEVISGLAIKTLVAGVGTGGNISVLRGANVVFQTAVSGTFEFGMRGFPITLDAAANVTVNFTGANCVALLELSKQTNPATANSTY